MKKKKTISDKFMDKALILIGAFLFVFTVVMIVTFWFKSDIPDVLVTAIFAACASECGVMGWIKNTKQKNPDVIDYEDIEEGE